MEKAIPLLDHNGVPFKIMKDSGDECVPTFFGQKEKGLTPKGPNRYHNSQIVTKNSGA